MSDDHNHSVGHAADEVKDDAKKAADWVEDKAEDAKNGIENEAEEHGLNKGNPNNNND